MFERKSFRHIKYSVSGSGPKLFLVGAPAGMNGFAALADALADQYSVVTHDPRGVGESTIPAGGSVDPEALSEDLEALIAHVGGEPVSLFGASGGAVTVLAMLARSPDLVKKAVLHEPPLFSLLPDSTDILSRADEAFKAARADPQKGLQLFSDLTQILDSTTDERSVPAPIKIPDLPPHELERQRFALGEMAPGTVHYAPLKQLPPGPCVEVAAGEKSIAQPARRAGALLAERLGRPLLDAPGNHLSPSMEPGEFARWLKTVLADQD